MHCIETGRRYQINETTLRQVLSLLEDIRDTQRVHSTLLQALVRKTNTVPDDVALPNEILFPMTCTEDFDKIEKELLDQAILNRVVSLLHFPPRCISIN